MAKDALLKAFDTDLSSGLLYERKAFTLLAATEDRNEGINAFWKNANPYSKDAKPMNFETISLSIEDGVALLALIVLIA